jgi:hypothetical protein
MYRETVINLPAQVRGDEEIREWLEEEAEVWRAALDLDVWQLDPRAYYVSHDVLQIDVQEWPYQCAVRRRFPRVLRMPGY